MIILTITRESVCQADDMEEHKIEMEISENSSYEELFKDIISKECLPLIVGNDVVWLLTYESIDIISYHTKENIFNNIYTEHMVNEKWKNLNIKYFSSVEKYKVYTLSKK